MKKTVLFAITLCLCFAVFGASFAEAAAAESPAAEKPAAEMTAEELCEAGRAACDAADYGKAMEYFQLAADAGNAEGWRGIGSLYANGEGVEMNLDKAREYFELAAEQGDAKALYNIGVLYQYAMGEEQDTAKAVEYYQKSGELGFAEAYTTLVSLYLYGNGVQQDTGKAAEYCQKAADLGVIQAFFDLGMMYYTGEGVGQDFGRAVTCFTQAAEQDVPAAMFMLGDCCRLGQGLEKDPVKAAEWYRKALEAGYDPDGEELEMLQTALGEDYSVFFPVPEAGKDYFVRTAPVLTGKEQTGSMDLRFYTSAPYVPYYGLKAYVNFMYQKGLTVTPLDGGVWEVLNPNGTKILANPSAGTIEAAD